MRGQLIAARVLNGEVQASQFHVQISRVNSEAPASRVFVREVPASRAFAKVATLAALNHSFGPAAARSPAPEPIHPESGHVVDLAFRGILVLVAVVQLTALPVALVERAEEKKVVITPEVFASSTSWGNARREINVPTTIRKRGTAITSWSE